jgi:hypothetical protein
MFILYYYLYSYVIIMFRFFCEELFIFVNIYYITCILCIMFCLEYFIINVYFVYSTLIFYL